jgi:hypothetical protein
MRERQMAGYVERIPTTKELLEFGLLFFLFFPLLRLVIYVDDLRLNGGLLVNHTFHDDDIIIVISVTHSGHAG